MTKADCAGCRENFYNGQNPYGIAECWSFKSAQLIMRKAVPVDQRPPWNQAAKPVPSCYRRKGYVYVAPEVCQ